MAMGSGGSGDGPQGDINVTPLVDVCLVLLIIFMVMIPKTVPEISVRVPPESKSPPKQQQKNESIVIGLNKDGGVSINRNGVDRAQLTTKLQSLLQGREPVVFVDFDDDVKYGDAVALLDNVRTSGAQVLGIYKRKDASVPDTLVGL